MEMLNSIKACPVYILQCSGTSSFIKKLDNLIHIVFQSRIERVHSINHSINHV